MSFKATDVMQNMIASAIKALSEADQQILDFAVREEAQKKYIFDLEDLANKALANIDSRLKDQEKSIIQSYERRIDDLHQLYKQQIDGLHQSYKAELQNREEAIIQSFDQRIDGLHRSYKAEIHQRLKGLQEKQLTADQALMLLNPKKRGNMRQVIDILTQIFGSKWDARRIINLAFKKNKK